MVRKPALELFSYLKSSNFAHPAVRYVICIFYHLLESRMQVKYEQVSLPTSPALMYGGRIYRKKELLRLNKSRMECHPCFDDP